jgi:HD-GYP domain-containing protein (c-di-GMP phosphodiesterase class II)
MLTIPRGAINTAASVQERKADMRALGLAAVMYLLVFAFRAVDPHAGDAAGLFYVLPLTVLALTYGVRGGLAGGVIAFLARLAWGEMEDNATLSTLGYVNRGVAFVMLGALVGFVSERRHTRTVTLAHELATQHSLGRQLTNSAARLRERVAERTYELESSRTETLRLLAIAAEYRDDDTPQHTARVGELAGAIGERLGLDAKSIEQLREAAPLHDVGKIGIPDHILLNRGTLSSEESDVMRTHAALGARLLYGSSSPVLQMAASIAATHHEWWDGSGYPVGLAGEGIPLLGRIVAVADAFDALTHDRPYKLAWPTEQAIARIARGAGTQFDPRVVEAFLALQGHAPTAKPNSTKEAPRTQPPASSVELRRTVHRGERWPAPTARRRGAGRRGERGS